MLAKLFKYEMKASGRILLPLFAALAVVSAAYCFIPANMSLYVIRFVLSLVYFAFFFATCLLSMFVAVLRFKNNILGNEGYLMNTIPVSPMSNVLAKLAAAVVYQLIGLSVAFASYGFVSKWFRFIDIGKFFSDMANWSSATWASIILYGVVLFLAIIMFDIAAYTALSIGHSFPAAKVVCSVAAFLVLWIAGTTLYVKVIDGLYPLLGPMVNFERELVVTIIFEAAYSLIGLVLTNYFLKNRLNLE